MDERIPCKTRNAHISSCQQRLPARRAIACPASVRAIGKSRKNISGKQKTIDAFSGITNPVEMLKLVHEPREHDPLIEWIPCPIPTDELYKSSPMMKAATWSIMQKNYLIPDGRRKLRKLRCARRHLPVPIWIISCAK